MLHRRSLSLCVLGSALVLASGSGAVAQTVVGPADVNRVQERAAQPVITQPSGDLVTVQGPVAVEAPAGADKFMLQLAGVSLEGLTVYAQADLEGLYADKVGKTISVADVYQIAAEITRKYRNAGYILTQVVVPPQTIESGNVRLQIVEGVVSKVSLEGIATDSERALILSYAEQVKGKPLNTRELERAILLINDLPGVSARGIISPSPTEVGAADLRVVAQRKSYEGLVSVDNFGSRYLGPLEGQLSVAGNSLFGHNERLSTNLIYAPGGGLSKELAYGDIVYDQPFGPFGTSVELKASLASTDPGFKLAQFDVNGHSTTYSVKIDQPIVRTRAVNWSVYGLFDVRNNSTQSNIDITRKDYIRALRAGTELNFLDSLFGVGYNTMTAEIAQGLSTFGASDNGDTTLSRAAGNPQFTKLNAEVERLQRLTGNINLLMGVRGQLANDAMLSSEEFGVGGPNYGRGYDPSEIVGDNGLAGKLELQFNDPVAFDRVKTYQLYGFLDGGRVWNEDATTSSDQEITVLSTGVGVRTTLLTGTEAGLYVALPLNRDVDALGNEDPRVYFNLQQRF